MISKSHINVITSNKTINSILTFLDVLRIYLLKRYSQNTMLRHLQIVLRIVLLPACHRVRLIFVLVLFLAALVLLLCTDFSLRWLLLLGSTDPRPWVQ